MMGAFPVGTWPRARQGQDTAAGANGICKPSLVVACHVMARHIGIVACSAEGAALCYRTVCIEGSRRMGRHDHPEVSLHTHSLARYEAFLDAGDWNGVAELMLDSARKLADVGAELLVCPDNTIHQAMPLVAARSPRPWLHIAEEVVASARQAGHQCLGILGTRWLMEGPVYEQAALAAGLRIEIPDEPDRHRINEVILDELVNGVIRSESRDLFNAIIARLGARGCDAVVLGCTEIPLLVESHASPLPTLDSTRLLARAAVRHAIG